MAGRLYEPMGGEAGIRSLVFRFYEAMETRPDAAEIRAMHDKDLSKIRDVLTSFLIMWAGGPQDYFEERGHPRLRRRHLPWRIDASHVAAWVACMDEALDAHPLDDELRRELKGTFARMASHIQNDPPRKV